MHIEDLTQELDKTIGHDWKVIQVEHENLIIEIPCKSFVDSVTKFMKEKYRWVKFTIEVVSPPILPNKPKIYRPKPHRPDPKLKAISYSSTKITIKNYDRYDDSYYLETFVFNDGSVWDRAQGKWTLIYQPEEENA